MIDLCYVLCGQNILRDGRNARAYTLTLNSMNRSSALASASAHTVAALAVAFVGIHADTSQASALQAASHHVPLPSSSHAPFPHAPLLSSPHESLPSSVRILEQPPHVWRIC